MRNLTPNSLAHSEGRMLLRWRLLSTMTMVALALSMSRTMIGMAVRPASLQACLRRWPAMISYPSLHSGADKTGDNDTVFFYACCGFTHGFVIPTCNGWSGKGCSSANGTMATTSCVTGWPAAADFLSRLLGVVVSTISFLLSAYGFG